MSHMSPTQKNQFSIKTLNEHSLGPGPFHGQSKFFIPMNLREQRTNHWSLVLVDILTKKVIVYDSLNPTEVTPEVSGNISKFLNCIIERPGIGLENNPENNDDIEVIYDPLVENANALLMLCFKLLLKIQSVNPIPAAVEFI